MDHGCGPVTTDEEPCSVFEEPPSLELLTPANSMGSTCSLVKIYDKIGDNVYDKPSLEEKNIVYLKIIISYW